MSSDRHPRWRLGGGDVTVRAVLTAGRSTWTTAFRTSVRGTTFCTLLALVACVSAPPKPGPPGSTASPTAPPPFTAEQIRAATAVGRRYTFRSTAAGGAPELQVVEYTKVTPTGFAFVAKRLTTDGQLIGESRSSEGTWDALVGHATYPASDTVITEATIDTAIGKMNCILYTVTTETDNGHQVTRAYFARELPGAPVRHEVHVNGVRVSLSEIVKHQAASPG